MRCWTRAWCKDSNGGKERFDRRTEVFAECTAYGTIPTRASPESKRGFCENEGKPVPAIFSRTEAGGEPVREWLKSLSPDDRKRIGEDIKSVEYGWPLGMPVCTASGERHLRGENRASLSAELHGCFSTSTRKAGWYCCTVSSRKLRKQPHDDLALAGSNQSKHQRGLE